MMNGATATCIQSLHILAPAEIQTLLPYTQENLIFAIR